MRPANQNRLGSCVYCLGCDVEQRGMATYLKLYVELGAELEPAISPPIAATAAATATCF